MWEVACDRFFSMVLEHMHLLLSVYRLDTLDSMSAQVVLYYLRTPASLVLCLQAGHTGKYGWLHMTDSSVLS